MTNKVKEYADILAEAKSTRVGITPLTSTNSELTIKEAYYIQLENINKKVKQGQKIVGKKIGLTSLAMQKLLGVDEPDYGHLLETTVVENGGRIPVEQVLQPKVEAEIAFILKKELRGPNVTALDVLQANEGRRIVGPKMGLTSFAKMKQMGIEEPIYGYVFDYMLIENGGKVRLSDLIHPKVEAEIAFVKGEDIEGPGRTGAQVLAKTEYVLPALEIIDSRYENFQFTLPDVIADNASTSRVVLGTTLKKPEQFELDLVGATLTINGEIKELGAGAAILGHPAHSVAMLANMLARKGEKVRKGDVILTGGITAAVKLNFGDVVSGKFDGFGEVSFTVID